MSVTAVQGTGERGNDKSFRWCSSRVWDVVLQLQGLRSCPAAPGLGILSCSSRVWDPVLQQVNLSWNLFLPWNDPSSPSSVHILLTARPGPGSAAAGPVGSREQSESLTQGLQLQQIGVFRQESPGRPGVSGYKAQGTRGHF